MTSTVIERRIQDRGIHGFRVTVVCSCGMETVQRAMDGVANFCGRCGYLTDYAYRTQEV